MARAGPPPLGDCNRDKGGRIDVAAEQCNVNVAVAEQALYTGNWGDFSGKVQALWDQMIAGKITPEDFGKQACDQTASTFKK